MGNFECVDIATARGLATFRGLKAHRPYCAKHNQHAKCANARGSGACPQEILKNSCSEIEFGAISVRLKLASYMIMY